jgi:hypothetical protein
MQGFRFPEVSPTRMYRSFQAHDGIKTRITEVRMFDFRRQMTVMSLP